MVYVVQTDCGKQAIAHVSANIRATLLSFLSALHKPHESRCNQFDEQGGEPVRDHTSLDARVSVVSSWYSPYIRACGTKPCTHLMVALYMFPLHSPGADVKPDVEYGSYHHEARLLSSATALNCSAVETLRAQLPPTALLVLFLSSVRTKSARS